MPTSEFSFKLNGALIPSTFHLLANTLDVSLSLKNVPTASFAVHDDNGTPLAIGIGDTVEILHLGETLMIGDVDEVDVQRLGAAGKPDVQIACRVTGKQRQLVKRRVGGDQSSWSNPPMAFRSMSGTVNTSGTAVAWASGNKFSPDMSGGSITINGVSYTVSSVASAESLTLSSTAGTQTGVDASTALKRGQLLKYLVAQFASGETVTTTKSRSGTVSTSGTAVTWVSGDRFAKDMQGQAITINGVGYTVSTVTNTEALVLAATAGTQTAVTYSATSTAYCADGGTITKQLFNYCSVMQAAKMLARQDGYVVRVDEKGSLYYAPRDHAPAAFAITDVSNNFEWISARTTREDVANTVHSRVSPSATTPRIEAFQGTGTDGAVFTTQYPIDAIESIFVDGAPHSWGQRGVDSDKDFEFDRGFRELHQNVDACSIPTTQVVQVEYRPVASDIVTSRDNAAIAARATDDGTSGKEERYADRGGARDTATAQADGDEQVEKRKDDTTVVSIRTRTPGVFPGQTIPISLTIAPYISGTFLVDSVKVTDDDGLHALFNITSGDEEVPTGPEETLGNQDSGPDSPGSGSGGPTDGGGPPSGGPGGGGPGSGGKTPEETAPAHFGPRDKCTFGVGIGEPMIVQADAAFWYAVFAPGGQIAKIKITVQRAPISDAVLDILKCTDRVGTTWTSILSTQIRIPAGFTGVMDHTWFVGSCGARLKEDDMLRIDVISAGGGTAEGIVVAIIFEKVNGEGGDFDFGETGYEQDAEALLVF